MSSATNTRVIYQLYQLMIEANLAKSEDEILSSLDVEFDPVVDKYLRKMKLLRSKAKAKVNKSLFETIVESFNSVMKIKELEKLFRKEDYMTLQTLYRKFEQSSEGDKMQILRDKRLLDLIKQAKEISLAKEQDSDNE